MKSETRRDTLVAGADSKRGLSRLEIASAFALALATLWIRAVHLSADPPMFLSWSAGIFTDEGIYAADARNMALFGHWSPGNFHGAIVSPLLYAVQLGVFRLCGASLESARMISVIAGLFAVVFLWVGMDRAFGRRSAWTAAILLAFCVPFVLYNRLALMETPVACCLTAVFACVAISREQTPQNTSSLVLGAALFVCAAAIKALAWLVLPAFLVALWKRDWRDAVWFLAIVAVFYAVYWLIVVAPYAGILARMNAYYVHHQYLPHSAAGVWYNVKRALVTGAQDGELPTLWKLTGALLMGSAFGLTALRRNSLAIHWLLAAWAILPMAAWAFISYTPTRYYVLILPALAGLTAIWLDMLPKHLANAVIAVVVGLNVLSLTAITLSPKYTERNAQMAAAKYYAEGLVAGQFAPELSFHSAGTSLYVQPGLANDDRPIERCGVKTVFVTRSRYWTNWWAARYPKIVMPARLVKTITVGGRYAIDIYTVR